MFDTTLRLAYDLITQRFEFETKAEDGLKCKGNTGTEARNEFEEQGKTCPATPARPHPQPQAESQVSEPQDSLPFVNANRQLM